MNLQLMLSTGFRRRINLNVAQTFQELAASEFAASLAETRQNKSPHIRTYTIAAGKMKLIQNIKVSHKYNIGKCKCPS